MTQENKAQIERIGRFIEAIQQISIPELRTISADPNTPQFVKKGIADFTEVVTKATQEIEKAKLEEGEHEQNAVVKFTDLKNKLPRIIELLRMHGKDILGVRETMEKEIEEYNIEINELSTNQQIFKDLRGKLDENTMKLINGAVDMGKIGQPLGELQQELKKIEEKEQSVISLLSLEKEHERTIESLDGKLVELNQGRTHSMKETVEDLDAVEKAFEEYLKENENSQIKEHKHNLKDQNEELKKLRRYEYYEERLELRRIKDAHRELKKEIEESMIAAKFLTHDNIKLIFNEKGIDNRKERLTKIKRGLSAAARDIDITKFKALITQLNQIIQNRLPSEVEMIEESIRIVGNANGAVSTMME